MASTLTSVRIPICPYNCSCVPARNLHDKVQSRVSLDMGKCEEISNGVRRLGDNVGNHVSSDMVAHADTVCAPMFCALSHLTRVRPMVILIIVIAIISIVISMGMILVVVLAVVVVTSWPSPSLNRIRYHIVYDQRHDYYYH